MEVRNYSRGYIPHRDIPGATQFLTWRIFDALTEEEWANWRTEYLSGDPTKKAGAYQMIERLLDEGRGAAHLRHPSAARAAMLAVLSFHREIVTIHALSVMPNHVHCVATIGSGIELGQAMKAIKGVSARHVNKSLGRRGRLWQPDYFDRAVRDEAHFFRCVNYTLWNPVRAGLAVDPRHYPFSTANETYAKILELAD